MKLLEGEVYPFQVLQKTSIPEEGIFFQLRHQSGRRLLIPESHYLNYNIELGKTIYCRVDKVSCTGKVYLEPKHPFYDVGKEYFFDIIDYNYTEEDQGKPILLVKDIFDNFIRVLCKCHKSKQSEKKINLYVEKIKKGIPQLTCPEDSYLTDYENLIGKKMDFNVLKIILNSSKEEVFLLSSNNGHMAHLKCKHYKTYGVELGNILTCEIYSYNSIGELKVEPINPYYEVDKTYNFEVESIDMGNGVSSEDITLMVRDIYGNLCGLDIDYPTALSLKDKTRLDCRVLGFRKGRPKLEMP